MLKLLRRFPSFIYFCNYALLPIPPLTQYQAEGISTNLEGKLLQQAVRSPEKFLVSGEET